MARPNPRHLALPLLLTTLTPAQTPAPRDHFLLQPDRPLAYLHLDHIGLGTPEQDGKSHERVWLELHNNCAFPLYLTVNGAPMGDSPDSVSVMDRLIPDFQYRILTPEEDAQLGPREMPRDTSFDVGSRYTINPGGELLFSLPASHFSKRWTIQIHLSFDLPASRTMRDSNAWGGDVNTFLSYSFYDLPERTQTELHALGF